eukprot:sb/3466265/
MRNHSNSPRIQVVGTALLMSMGADEEAIADIGEEGGIQDVLAALRAYPNNPEVSDQGRRVVFRMYWLPLGHILTTLSVLLAAGMSPGINNNNNNNISACIPLVHHGYLRAYPNNPEEGGIQDVLAALRAYPNNPEVSDQGRRVVFRMYWLPLGHTLTTLRLVIRGGGWYSGWEEGGIQDVLAALRAYPNNPEVSDQGRRVVFRMYWLPLGHTLTTLRLVIRGGGWYSGWEEGGIQDVLAALRAYPNNPEVSDQGRRVVFRMYWLPLGHTLTTLRLVIRGGGWYSGWEEGGIQDVLAALRAYPNNPEVSDQGRRVVFRMYWLPLGHTLTTLRLVIRGGGWYSGCTGCP